MGASNRPLSFIHTKSHIMAQNYIESGERFEYVVPTGETITSGQIVKVGSLAGVALGSGVEGDTVVIALKGVYKLVNDNNENIPLGATLYLDATNEITTSPDDGETPAVPHTPFGWAWSASANSSQPIFVKLK